MSSTSLGRSAEDLAARYLAQEGYEIIDRNWRNRWCEIDIIAARQGVIHIIEVKYRKNTRYGYAAEYISHDKAARLVRAALSWTWSHNFNGDYQIDVIAVEGPMTAPQISHIPSAISYGTSIRR